MALPNASFNATAESAVWTALKANGFSIEVLEDTRSDRYSERLLRIARNEHELRALIVTSPGSDQATVFFIPKCAADGPFIEEIKSYIDEIEKQAALRRR